MKWIAALWWNFFRCPHRYSFSGRLKSITKWHTWANIPVPSPIHYTAYCHCIKRYQTTTATTTSTFIIDNYVCLVDKSRKAARLTKMNNLIYVCAWELEWGRCCASFLPYWATQTILRRIISMTWPKLWRYRPSHCKRDSKTTWSSKCYSNFYFELCVQRSIEKD